MGRRGKRIKIARCIYEDKTGRAGIYRGADGKPKEIRFLPGTPISAIRDALHDAQKRARGSGQLSTIRGTLAEAVDRWEPLEQHIASWKERRAELRAWVRELKDKRLTAITSDDVRRVMGLWKTQGLAPKTIRNRLWSLRHLYRVLQGAHARTPVDDVTPPAKIRTVPYHASPALILTVYGNLLRFEKEGRLLDAKTRARFMVRASTGKRPSEIMRAQPDDVDLSRRTWRVRDGKGGWSEGLFLNNDMLAAWATFIQADAWGPFDTGSMAEVLRAACWPDGVRPYNLRHSIGIDLSEGGADLADVSGWLGHTDPRTTRNVYAPILNSRMQKLSAQLEGRLNGWTVPSSVPSSTVEQRGKPRETGAIDLSPQKRKTRRIAR